MDIAGNLVERAGARVAAEGLRARFEEADAEALPYEDETFDVVTSLFGAMFAPQPDLVAQELLRLCRPGGTIAMANWTPQGFVGQIFKTVSTFIAPSGMPSPVLWGDETTVRERLGKGLAELQLVRRDYKFNYPFLPSEVVEFFRLYYRPINQAFAALDVDGGARLHQELEALWSAHNRAGAGCIPLAVQQTESSGRPHLDLPGSRAVRFIQGIKDERKKEWRLHHEWERLLDWTRDGSNCDGPPRSVEARCGKQGAHSIHLHTSRGSSRLHP